MSEPIVFIPFGSHFLALTASAFQEAHELAAQLLPSKPNEAIGEAPDTEPMLTAQQISEVTGVPSAWYLEAARKREVQHYRFGKYVRFKLSELAGKGRVPVKKHLELVTKG